MASGLLLQDANSSICCGFVVQPLAETSLRILAYLAAHPRAQDTVEGIHQWWLSPPLPTLASVERAILELERAGLVIKTDRPDGSQHFRMNPLERESIAAALYAAGLSITEPEEAS